MSTVIPLGPYHPLQEEPEFFKLHVEGERVVGLDIELGYNHRGIERILEMKTYDQVPLVVERICGICSTSHPFASVNAMEDLLGIDIPERAQYIRTITGELERVHSHLLWLGLAGHFIGYNTVFMWAWKYRETVLDIFEKISGNRQNYSMMKVGGVRRDIKKDEIPKYYEDIEGLVPIVQLFKGAVMDDPVIHARLKGVGVLSKEDAIRLSAVGPTARASGVDIDVRRDDPYAAYDEVDWKVITCEEGDVFAKAVVRLLELEQSVSIIQQCFEKIPDGDIEVEVREMPVGEGIGRAEAPRGEVFHYIRSDGANSPVRYKVRAPSYMNVFTNTVVVIGETVSDAALALAAVDPCYCCTDRMAVIDAKSGKKVMDSEALIKLSQEKTEEIRKRMTR